MEQDPFKKEQYLRMKLDEDHIEVPDFPMNPKRKRWERLVDVLASPAKNPMEPVISTTTGFVVVKVAPVIGALAVSFIQVILFL
jgi:hypothetical protein